MDKIKLTDDFGKGVSSSCAYDTACVALVPSKSDKEKPAFLKSVEWLRNNQLDDGSWGSKFICNAHDRVICTIQTLLVFLTWNHTDDNNIIKNGCSALEKHMAQLENASQEEMTVGFELFLPNLVDECKKYGLDFDNEYVKRLRFDREMKREKIKKFRANSKIIQGDPIMNNWLHTLEGFGDVYGPGDYEAMIGEDGTICSSYSSTAYAIIQDPSLELSFAALEKVVNANNGGIPVATPMNPFALGYSLTALYMAGIDLSCQEFEVHLEILKKIFDDGDGLTGATKALGPDGDTNSACLLPMYASKLFREYKYIDKMIKRFYSGSYFTTFPIEKNASVLTNMHALMALKAYGSCDKTKPVIDKVAQWLCSEMSAQERYPFVDKWTISPLTLMSHFVFAMLDINNEMVSEMVEKIVALQNCDNGWGTEEKSSLEESAISVLAISHWSNKFKIENYKGCLEKAKIYFQTKTEGNFPELWIAKGLYCLPSYTNALILAAKYALGLQKKEHSFSASSELISI